MFQDPLEIGELQRPLDSRRLTGPWLLVDQTASTNDLAREQAQNRAPEGTVVVADQQTRGRGRRGRVWESPPGLGIYLSVLLKPPLPDTPLAPLTLLAGVAAANALDSLVACSPNLKWPNDLLLKEKKTGGILCEFCPEAASPTVIVGIGLNVHQETAHFPGPLQKTATSVFLATGRRLCRNDLIRAVVLELDRQYGEFLDAGAAPILSRWSARTGMFGRRVTLAQGARRVEGIALRLDAGGCLVLNTASGETAFDAGEVTLLPE